MDNKTLDLYRKGATLSKFILEGRPTTMKRLSLLFEPSDETIQRLYDIPITKNYIDDYLRQHRQESSISSQLEGEISTATSGHLPDNPEVD